LEDPMKNKKITEQEWFMLTIVVILFLLGSVEL